MAIIQLAAPISGIRGKVGGLIYSQNKGGPYLKQWARSSNPRSLPQSNNRSLLVKFATFWNTLNNAERATWDVYAALPAQDLINSLGETYSISGFNWFIRINMNRASDGQNTRRAAPTAGTPATPIIEVVNAFSSDSAGVTNIRLIVGSPGLGERLAIHAVMAPSAGSGFVAQVNAFMLTQQLAVGVRNFGFKDELIEHFGTQQIGQKVFCTIRQQSMEGRRSAPAAGSAEILT